ncbi:MAG: OadG family transporter subunit [Propionicimonas sp.]
MDNVGFGLYLTLYGMGTVLGLLLLLMLALKAIGWYDQRRTVRPAAREGNAAARLTDQLHEPLPQNPDELSPELLAAISIAVITHARVRRGQAAPAMRQFEPGSQLFASRWVAVGRSYQNHPWRREN